MIENTFIDSSNDINGEDIWESISTMDNADIENVKFWDSEKELEKHDDGGEKPWILISREINEATKSLLETRMITINGVDIKYVISITKRWKGKVDDCQVRDSYLINDPEIMNKFIETVVFSYPDLTNSRNVPRKRRKSREELLKESYFWERMAHNYVYYLMEIWNFDEFVQEHTYLKKLLYKLKDCAWHVDFDDENLMVQNMFKYLWQQYLSILKNKK